MFLNIDHNKTTKKLKLHLAKPNKEIISIISEKYDDKVNVALGNISELNFSIPYFVEDNDGNLIRNRHTDLIKEKMLIRANLDNRYEWFVVENIDEDGGDNEEFSVQCYSLGTELSNKLIDGISEDGVSIKTIVNKILENTNWKLGSVALKIEQARRSFELDETNALESIIQIAGTYGAVLDWNTENRIINFLDIEKIGKYKGLSVDYGRLLKSISKKRTVDELTTRLHVYGAEDVGIYEHNPSGTSYLEDFSYFMYPFERDVNRKVIKSSYYMSDSLCHALLDQKKLVDSSADELESLRKQIQLKQTEYIKANSLVVQIGSELGIIRDKLDVAKASGNTELQNTLTAEYNAKEAEFNSKKSISDALNVEIKNLKESLEYKQYQISSSSTLTQSQIDELKLFVIEKKWKDDRYIDSKELYDDAVEKFREIRQPKIVVEIDIENLLEIVEEQVYWDRLVLGDKIKVKYPYMNIDFMARIMAIEYDFSNKNIKVTISNSLNVGNEIDAIADSLYKSNHTSSILTNNKWKWDKTEVIEDEVFKLINEEYDAVKKKILAGVNNSVEIGGRGIIVRNPDFPNEMIILQSGVIALSKNNGDDWQTAITPDGVIAERIIGNLIIGRNLVMTNGSNSLYFDNDGMRVHANAFKITSGDSMEEKPLSEILDSFQYDIDGVLENVSSQLKVIEDEILASVSADIKKLNGDLVNVQSSIQTTIGKISLIVSETNEINGEKIASAIALTPSAIKIISDNIDITGKVTFNSLDKDFSNNISGLNTTIDNWKSTDGSIDGNKIATGTVNGNKITEGTLEIGKQVLAGNIIKDIQTNIDFFKTWKSIGTNTTTINGGKIETNTIQANHIVANAINANKISANAITSDKIYANAITSEKIATGAITADKIAVGELVVGKNVTMGAGSYITWNNISNPPKIPTSASDIGALPSTYIDASGVFTGFVKADKIQGKIAIVDDKLLLGGYTSAEKRIIFNGSNYLIGQGDNFTISSANFSINCSWVSAYGNWDFSQANSVKGLSATAKFG